MRMNGWGVCYTQMDWAPLLVPIRGTYNTYGCIEKIKTGPHTEALLKYFSDPNKYRVLNRGCDKGPDDNPPFDTVEKLLNCIERGYLQIRQHMHHSEVAFDKDGNYDYSKSSGGYYLDWADTGYMLMHAHVFDSLVGPSELFKKIIDDRLKGVYDQLRVMEMVGGREFSEADRNDFLLRRFCDAAFCDCSFSWDLLGYSPVIVDPLLQMIPKLDLVMMELRKFYSPQAGASQESNDKAITRLHRLTQSVIKRRNKRWKE
jgi:hypothetical protein